MCVRHNWVAMLLKLQKGSYTFIEDIDLERSFYNFAYVYGIFLFLRKHMFMVLIRGMEFSF
jgi:hypothetical protein